MQRTTLAVRVVGVACAGALMAGCLSGCGSTASASTLLTSAQAKAVAQKWLHADIPTEIREEGGSLHRVDEAVIPLQSPAPTPDARIRDDTIWMTRQTQYPLSFLCFDKPLVGGGQTVPGQIFSFSKTSPSVPWTVTHQIELFSMASRPAVALDSDGYAQTVSPQDYGRLLVSPARLGPEYAAYLTAGNASDAREFAPGELTTQTIETNRRTVDGAAAKHYSATTTYAVTSDPVIAYVLRDGGALVLLGVQLTGHLVARDEPIKVTQDGKGVVGPPPGSYRELTNVALIMAAFTVPPKGGNVKVSGIGTYGGPVTTTGTPA